MKDYSKQTSKELLSIGAVFLRPENPFIWASGIKSPIYCDNRLILTNVEVRNNIENRLSDLIIMNYPDCELLMGTSTAGIAHAAICSHILGFPAGYVRTGSKDHGRKNRIEGRVMEGQKTVVVEDLISTGRSAVDVVKTLREAGADVIGIISIFTYNMEKGTNILADERIRNISLTDLDTTVKVAVREGYITPSDEKRILAFRDNPDDESWISL